MLRNFNSKYNGSNLIEYAIPLAVIAIVVGMTVYAFGAGDFLETAIFKSSPAKKAIGSDKLSFGNAATSPGLYIDSKGYMSIVDQNGAEYKINKEFYDKYKDDILADQQAGKFEFGEAAETSGTAGVNFVSNNQSNVMRAYSQLVDIASRNNDDKTAQDLLASMSKLGFKVSDLEDKLVDLNITIKDAQKDFQTQERTYQQILATFQEAVNQYNKSNIGSASKTELDLVDSDFKALQKAYGVYSNAATKYQNTCQSSLNSAKSDFNDLKNITGKQYDEVLNEIIATPKIDQATKDVVVPIGEGVKAVKDSVDLMEKTFSALITTFDTTNNTFDVASQDFSSFQVLVDWNAKCNVKNPPPDC